MALTHMVVVTVHMELMEEDTKLTEVVNIKHMEAADIKLMEVEKKETIRKTPSQNMECMITETVNSTSHMVLNQKQKQVDIKTTTITLAMVIMVENKVPGKKLAEWELMLRILIKELLISILLEMFFKVSVLSLLLPLYSITLTGHLLIQSALLFSRLLFSSQLLRL